jgi:hypothetical protein
MGKIPASCKTSRQAHATSNWLGATLVTVPRPQSPKGHVGLRRTGNDEPQGPAGSHEQPQGIGAHNVCELATLVLGYPIIGMAVTDIDFHGPAIGIRLQHDVGGQRHLGAEKGFQRFETPKGFFAAGCWAVCTVRPPDHHNPYGPSGEDAVPYPHPRLDEGPRFLRVRLPRGRRRGQGFGRADHRAFFARCPALAFATRGRQLLEFGRE